MCCVKHKHIRYRLSHADSLAWYVLKRRHTGKQTLSLHEGRVPSGQKFMRKSIFLWLSGCKKKSLFLSLPPFNFLIFMFSNFFILRQTSTNMLVVSMYNTASSQSYHLHVLVSSLTYLSFYLLFYCILQNSV